MSDSLLILKDTGRQSQHLWHHNIYSVHVLCTHEKTHSGAGAGHNPVFILVFNNIQMADDTEKVLVLSFHICNVCCVNLALCGMYLVYNSSSCCSPLSVSTLDLFNCCAL